MSKLTKTIAVLGVVAGLGVAALPMSTYAASYSRSTNTIVKTEVEGAISISADMDMKDGETYAGIVDLGKLSLNSTTTEMVNPLKVTVTSNAAQDYTLSISTLGNTNDMIGKNTSSIIPAGVPTAGTSAWGYSVLKKDASDYTAYKAVPATSSETIDTFSTVKTGDEDATNTTNFKFKASANGTQTPDEYEVTVVFTATVTDAPAN